VSLVLSCGTELPVLDLVEVLLVSGRDGAISGRTALAGRMVLYRRESRFAVLNVSRLGRRWSLLVLAGISPGRPVAVESMMLILRALDGDPRGVCP
jgi:hypothetical protein